VKVLARRSYPKLRAYIKNLKKRFLKQFLMKWIRKLMISKNQWCVRFEEKSYNFKKDFLSFHNMFNDLDFCRLCQCLSKEKVL